jgi:hypothetical protein
MELNNELLLKLLPKLNWHRYTSCSIFAKFKDKWTIITSEGYSPSPVKSILIKHIDAENALIFHEESFVADMVVAAYEAYNISGKNKEDLIAEFNSDIEPKEVIEARQ